MNRIRIYAMNHKGFAVLQSVTEGGFTSLVESVVSARDENVEHDFYDEIQSFCEKHGMAFHNRNEEGSFTEPGWKIAIGWRWIIQEDQNLIVLHDSLLPRYRGFNPLVSALINGDREIGVTALLATREFDRGPVIDQKLVSISYPIKIQTAIEKISELYADIVLGIFDAIQRGKNIESVEQDESKATYSLWRDEEDYHLVWSKSASTLKRTVDACGFPYKGAKSYVEGRTIRIREVEEVEDVRIENRGPGKVIFLSDGMPVVVCGEGLLKITEAVWDDDQTSFIPCKKFRTRFE